MWLAEHEVNSDAYTKRRGGEAASPAWVRLQPWAPVWGWPLLIVPVPVISILVGGELDHLLPRGRVCVVDVRSGANAAPHRARTKGRPRQMLRAAKPILGEHLFHVNVVAPTSREYRFPCSLVFEPAIYSI